MRRSTRREQTPSLRGSLIVRTQRGMLTAQRWPRPRGPNRHPTNREWTEWLKQATELSKWVPPIIWEAAREAGRKAAALPRDLIIASMRGRLFAIQLDDKGWYYPLAAARDISESLDIIAQWKGSLLVRGDDLWIPLRLGEPDQLLTVDAATGMPVWRALEGLPGTYTPPTPAAFSQVLGSPTPTLVSAETGPLVMSRAPATGTANACCALRALDTPPHLYVFGLRGTKELLTNAQWGICLRDSTSGRLVSFALRYLTATSTPILSLSQWNSLTSYQSQTASRGILHTNTLFLAVQDDGTNFNFLVSSDDAGYIQAFTTLRTAWLAAPDQIGLFISSGATENIGCTLACLHYRHTAA